MAESIVKKLLTKLAASLPKEKLAKFKLGDLFKKKKKGKPVVEESEEEESSSEGTEVIASDSDKTGEIDVTELREGAADTEEAEPEAEAEEKTETKAASESEVEADEPTEEADEVEEVDADKTIAEDKSIINKLKNKLLSKFKKSKKKDDGTSTNTKIKTQTKTNFSLPKESKKLDRSKIIKIVVTLAIIYFVVDEFVLNEQQDDAATETKVAAVKPTRKKPKKVVPTPTPDPTVVAEAPPVESTKVEEPENETKPAVEVPEVAPAPEVATPVDQNPSLETPMGEEVPVSAPAPAEQPVVEPISEPAPAEAVEVVATTNEDANEKVKEKMDKTEIAEVEKIKFERAPNYEVLGRGLVYNCEGKHWACIDKEGFSHCEMNKKWHEQKGSKPSCVPFQVYENEADCGKAQQGKVNEAIKTDFCK